MRNLYRIYLTTLNGLRQLTTDFLILAALWEKVHHLFPVGIPH